MRDASSNTEFSEANVARSVQAAVLIRSCVRGFSCRILWGGCIVAGSSIATTGVT